MGLWGPGADRGAVRRRGVGFLSQAKRFRRSIFPEHDGSAAAAQSWGNFTTIEVSAPPAG